MADYVTKADLEEVLDKRFKVQTDEIVGIIQGFATQIDDRFNKVESDIADIKQNLNRLTNTLDSFIKRLDDNEQEMAARDAQFQRLLKWARKVSKQTGIPLEDL